MAKQSGGMPKIDEDFMKELISQGVPSKQDNNKTNDVPQETQTETVYGYGYFCYIDYVCCLFEI